jgi:hypothetical protein
MTDTFNTRVETFRLLADGSLHERRTEINKDGSLGEIHGSEAVIGVSDAALFDSGFVKVATNDQSAAP